MKKRETPGPRRAGLVVLAAVIAAALAVTPSFAGTAFPGQKELRQFVTKHQAHARYVSKKAARKTLVDQNSQPIALSTSSTAAFQSTATAPQLLSGPSDVTFKMPELGQVIVTFSGTSLCSAAATGKTCPIRLYVDGQLASTGAQTFDASSSSTTPTAHTIVQTAVVDKGTHAVDVAYGGNTAGNVTFKLSSWNLVVQGYPGDSAP